MSDKTKCMKCFGKGFLFKPDGFTDSDKITCPRCNGECYAQNNKKKKQYKRNIDNKKNSGIDQLNEVEAV